MRSTSLTFLSTWIFLSFFVCIESKSQTDEVFKIELLKSAIAAYEKFEYGNRDPVRQHWFIIGSAASLGELEIVKSEISKARKTDQNKFRVDAVIEFLRAGHIDLAKSLFKSIVLDQDKLELYQLLGYVSALPKMRATRLMDFLVEEFNREIISAPNFNAHQAGQVREGMSYCRCLGFLNSGEFASALKSSSNITNPEFRRRFNWDYTIEQILSGDFETGVEFAKKLRPIERLVAYINVLIRLDEKDATSEFGHRLFDESIELFCSFNDISSQLESYGNDDKWLNLPRHKLAIIEKEFEGLGESMVYTDTLLNSMIDLCRKFETGTEFLIDQIGSIKSAEIRKRLIQKYIFQLFSKPDPDKAMAELKRLESMVETPIFKSKNTLNQAMVESLAAAGQFVRAKKILLELPKNDQSRAMLHIGGHQLERGLTTESTETVAPIVEQFQSGIRKLGEEPKTNAHKKLKFILESNRQYGWQLTYRGPKKLPLEDELLSEFTKIKEHLDKGDAIKSLQTQFGSFTRLTDSSLSVCKKMLQQFGVEPIARDKQAYRPPPTISDSLRALNENDVNLTIKELVKQLSADLSQAKEVGGFGVEQSEGRLGELAIEMAKRGLRSEMLQVLKIIEGTSSHIEALCGCARKWPPKCNEWFEGGIHGPAIDNLPIGGGGLF